MSIITKIARRIVNPEVKNGVFTMQFEKENGRWYAVVPEWRLAKGHLEMVAGADDFLDMLLQSSKDQNLVTINILGGTSEQDCLSKSDNEQPEWTFTMTDKPYTGANYVATNGSESHNMWLCDVLEFVMGYFPETIFVWQKEKA